jgi:hypothetical protein
MGMRTWNKLYALKEEAKLEFPASTAGIFLYALRSFCRCPTAGKEVTSIALFSLHYSGFLYFSVRTCCSRRGGGGGVRGEVNCGDCQYLVHGMD